MAVASIFILAITSCSNEELSEIMLPAETRATVNAPQKEFLKFKYQGVQYTAEYEIQDTAMIFTDPEITNMMCEIENNPNLATLTYPDGMVEYFNSDKELEEFIENGKAFSINTYSILPPSKILTSITLKVYEDFDFQAEVITYNGPTSVPDLHNATNITNLVELHKNFNDKISSFQLTGNLVQLNPNFPPPAGTLHHAAIVTFYKAINYESKTKSFMIDTNNPQVSHNNFKKIKFNDETSSIKLYWSN